jgi:RNA polymerase sigma-70 factor (sigma-E family)
VDHEAEYVEFARAKLPWLRRLAYALTQDAHTADDIVQATLTKLYLHWRTIRIADNLNGYVRIMLVRTYLADRRLAWHRVALRERVLDPPVPAGYPGLDQAAALDLRAALRRLPPRQRATLVLRYYCDLSVEDTARALNCSTGTVKSQSARAFTTLRSWLADPAATTTGGRRA